MTLYQLELAARTIRTEAHDLVLASHTELHMAVYAAASAQWNRIHGEWRNASDAAYAAHNAAFKAWMAGRKTPEAAALKAAERAAKAALDAINGN